jgi:hypothetical protein
VCGKKEKSHFMSRSLALESAAALLLRLLFSDCVLLLVTWDGKITLLHFLAPRMLMFDSHSPPSAHVAALLRPE